MRAIALAVHLVRLLGAAWSPLSVHEIRDRVHEIRTPCRATAQRTGAAPSSRAIPAAHASIAGQSRQSPSGRNLRTTVRSTRPISLKSDVARSKAPANTRQSRGRRFRRAAATSLGSGCGALGRPIADRTAAEQPQRVGPEGRRVPLQERRRPLEPVAALHGAADDERAIRVHGGDVVGRAHLDGQPGPRQDLADPLGDPLRGPEAARVRHQDRVRHRSSSSVDAHRVILTDGHRPRSAVGEQRATLGGRGSLLESPWGRQPDFSGQPPARAPCACRPRGPT